MKQLKLGELIDKISAIDPTWGEDNQEKNIVFDFGTAVPTTLNSWRGDYSQIALGYSLTGYDRPQTPSIDNKYSSVLKELESGIGNVFEGWKGGDFRMDRSTRLWVDNSGNSSRTGIFDVTDEGYEIILHTKYFEY